MPVPQPIRVDVAGGRGREKAEAVRPGINDSERTSLLSRLPSTQEYELRYSVHFRTLGISQIVTGACGVVVFIGYIAYVHGFLDEIDGMMYSAMGGAVLFIITGAISHSISQNPKFLKLLVGFIFGLVNLVFDIFVGIMQLNFITDRQESSSEDKDIVWDRENTMVVIFLVHESLKLIQTMAFLHYITRQ